jgi:hypothetical protein
MRAPVKKQHRTGRDIPEPHGRTAVVTGADTGVGFAIASLSPSTARTS